MGTADPYALIAGVAVLFILGVVVGLAYCQCKKSQSRNESIRASLKSNEPNEDIHKGLESPSIEFDIENLEVLEPCPCGGETVLMTKCPECKHPARACGSCEDRLTPCACDEPQTIEQSAEPLLEASDSQSPRANELEKHLEHQMNSWVRMNEQLASTLTEMKEDLRDLKEIKILEKKGGCPCLEDHLAKGRHDQQSRRASAMTHLRPPDARERQRTWLGNFPLPDRMSGLSYEDYLANRDKWKLWKDREFSKQISQKTQNDGRHSLSHVDKVSQEASQVIQVPSHHSSHNQEEHVSSARASRTLSIRASSRHSSSHGSAKNERKTTRARSSDFRRKIHEVWESMNAKEKMIIKDNMNDQDDVGDIDVRVVLEIMSARPSEFRFKILNAWDSIHDEDSASVRTRSAKASNTPSVKGFNTEVSRQSSNSPSIEFDIENLEVLEPCPCGGETVIMTKCPECKHPARACASCEERLTSCACDRRLSADASDGDGEREFQPPRSSSSRRVSQQASQIDGRQSQQVSKEASQVMQASAHHLSSKQREQVSGARASTTPSVKASRAPSIKAASRHSSSHGSKQNERISMRALRRDIVPKIHEAVESIHDKDSASVRTRNAKASNTPSVRGPNNPSIDSSVSPIVKEMEKHQSELNSMVQSLKDSLGHSSNHSVSGNGKQPIIEDEGPKCAKCYLPRLRCDCKDGYHQFTDEVLEEGLASPLGIVRDDHNHHIRSLEKQLKAVLDRNADLTKTLNRFAGSREQYKSEVAELRREVNEVKKAEDKRAEDVLQNPFFNPCEQCYRYGIGSNCMPSQSQQLQSQQKVNQQWAENTVQQILNNNGLKPNASSKTSTRSMKTSHHFKGVGNVGVGVMRPIPEDTEQKLDCYDQGELMNRITSALADIVKYCKPSTKKSQPQKCGACYQSVCRCAINKQRGNTDKTSSIYTEADNFRDKHVQHLQKQLEISMKTNVELTNTVRGMKEDFTNFKSISKWRQLKSARDARESSQRRSCDPSYDTSALSEVKFADIESERDILGRYGKWLRRWEKRRFG